MLVNAHLSDLRNPVGFGDFIRGSVSCHQICHKNGIDFDMHFGLWQPFFKSKFNSSINRNSVSNLIQRVYSFSQLESYIKRVENPNIVKYVFTNFWPEKSTPNPNVHRPTLNLKGWGYISQTTKNFIKSRLIPTNRLINTFKPVDASYEVAHIRLFDEVNCSDVVDNSTLKDLASTALIKVLEAQYDIDCKLLVITNSVFLREFIKQEVKAKGLEEKIIFTITDPVHSGIPTDLDNMVGTMHDFLYLRNANKIHQISVYPWGSGFSEVSHRIYDIPLQSYDFAISPIC